MPRLKVGGRHAENPCVTLVEDPRPTSACRMTWAERAYAALPTAAVLAALAWWGTYLTFATGGREPRMVTVGSLLVLAAALLVRPWVVVSARAWALATAPGAGRPPPAGRRSLLLAVVTAASLLAAAVGGWGGGLSLNAVVG